MLQGASLSFGDRLPAAGSPLFDTAPAFGGTVELQEAGWRAIVVAAHRHEAQLERLERLAVLGAVGALVASAALAVLALAYWRLARRVRALDSSRAQG